MISKRTVPFTSKKSYKFSVCIILRATDVILDLSPLMVEVAATDFWSLVPQVQIVLDIDSQEFTD
jgi:hypothetical protein